MAPTFKLISSSSVETFEERFNHFVATLGADDLIVDVKFSTAPLGEGVMYCALVHYQRTESWSGG